MRAGRVSTLTRQPPPLRQVEPPSREHRFCVKKELSLERIHLRDKGELMPARYAALLLVLVTAGAAGVAATGPGDPASVFVSGFTTPCRTTFDGAGNLYVVDLPVSTIYRVTPDGSTSVFTDHISMPRGITFDPFGDMLVADRAAGIVYKVTPQGQVSPFLEVFNAVRGRVGPNGDIWVAAVDTLHHFDAMGRPLEKIDVRAQGAAAWDLRFTPDGALYFSSFPDFWKLDGQTVLPVLTGQQGQNSAPHFDVAGNAYWAHEATDAGDTHRVILADGNFTVVEDSFATFAAGPCAMAFGRDPFGATTNRLFISLRDGSIVELSSAGIAAAGVPEVGLSLTDLDESEVANEILGVASLVTADQAYFLDVIGNDDGNYDVGDFRAYLVATDVVD
jgi:hypothetical protein